MWNFKYDQKTGEANKHHSGFTAESMWGAQTDAAVMVSLLSD